MTPWKILVIALLIAGPTLAQTQSENRTQRAAERFFERNDKNEDGKLSREEFPERQRRLFDRIDADIRALGQSTKDDIQELKKSVDTAKKIIWTAAGIVIAIGLLGSFLFESGDLIAGIPFEITIKSPPGP